MASSAVNVIDTRTATIVLSIAVATYPRAIAIGPDGRFAYVTHTSAGCSVIDLQRVTGSAGLPTFARSRAAPDYPDEAESAALFDRLEAEVGMAGRHG